MNARSPPSSPARHGQSRRPRSKVELLRGHTSRHKMIKLHGRNAEAVAAKLA